MTPTTVSSLPAELLLDIFDLSDIGPLAWAAVSTDWRRFALCTPVMWTSIVLEDGRPEDSLERCKLFAARSGHQLLSLARIGTFSADFSFVTPAYDDEAETPVLRILDMLCEQIFGRCKSYSYVSVDRGSICASHLSRLFTSAPHLRELHLSAQHHHLPPIIVSEATRASATEAPFFPNLVHLNLSCTCIPLLPIAGPMLESFHLEIDCVSHEDDCQNYPDVAAGILRIITNSRSLRDLELSIYLDYDDIDYDRAPLFDILTPSLHNVHIANVPIEWPDIAVLQITPRMFSCLKNLTLAGSATQPLAPDGDCSIELFIHLFRLTPHLQSISILEWTLPPTKRHGRIVANGYLPELREISFQNSLPIYESLLVGLLANMRCK